MPTQKALDPKFEIQALPSYVPADSKPEQSQHFFSYKIIIKNTGNTTAQLISRHWIITDGFGHVEEVRGPGVIGQQPKIPAGQSFEYESACPLSTPIGSMKGFFHMEKDDGEKFTIEVPEFFLVAPSALH